MINEDYSVSQLGFVVAISLFMAATPTAAADSAQFYYSSADLFDTLRSDSTRQPVDIGYVAGVADAAGGRPSASSECFRIPQGIPVRQLGDSVTNWLDHHPTARSGGAAAAVVKTLQKAHPRRP